MPDETLKSQVVPPVEQEGAVNFSPTRSTFQERMDEEDEGYRVPDVKRTALPAFAVPIAEEALAFKGKKALKPQELIQMGSDIVGGNAGWVALKTTDENGAVKNSFAISQKGKTTSDMDTQKMISSNEVMKSLEKYGKQIEATSGAASARIIMGEVSDLFTSKMGLPKDPINSKPLVLDEAVGAMVRHGFITPEQTQAGYDSDNVEVNVAVDPSVMGKVVTGGIEAWANGVPKTTAFAGVTAAVADMPEFKKAGAKQKMFMLERAYDGFMKGASAKADEINAKTTIDQMKAKESLVQGFDNAVKDGITKDILIPLSTATKETKYKENIKLSKELDAAKRNNELAKSKVLSEGSSLATALEASGVNTKGFLEQLRTGRDSSRVTVEQINRIDDLNVRSQAIAAYQAWESSMKQVASGNELFISEATERIAKNNEELTKGMAVDSSKLYGRFGNMSTKAVSYMSTHPEEFKQFFEECSVQNPDKVYGMDEQEYNARKTQHAQMLVLNKMVDLSNIGVSPEIQNIHEDTRRELAEAITAGGSIDRLPGGQAVIEGAKQAIEEAKLQASYKPRSDYDTFVTALKNNHIIFGEVGVDLASIVKGKNPDGITIAAVKADLTARYAKYGNAVLKNFLTTFDAKVKELQGVGAVKEAASTVLNPNDPEGRRSGGNVYTAAQNFGGGRQVTSSASITTPKFATKEEAGKAGLPIGTIVLINGRRAKIN